MVAEGNADKVGNHQNWGLSLVFLSLVFAISWKQSRLRRQSSPSGHDTSLVRTKLLQAGTIDGRRGSE